MGKDVTLTSSMGTAVIGLLCIAPVQSATAVGTVAGTVVSNTAEIRFEVAGNPLTRTSNTDSFTVAEVLDVDTALQSGATAVTSPDTARELLYVVTNTGNGSESFPLQIDSVLGGDDFDPLPAVPAIYFDTDGSGDLSGPDIAYSPGVNDPVLAGDASVDILIVNDIPAGLSDGDTGLSRLSATAISGSGTPGDVFPGAGDGGVDAVVGTSGASDGQAGQYSVAEIQIGLVKSATLADPFGGTEPVSGADVTYQIVVTPTGSATATNATFSDPIPPNTTYVAGTIELNGAPLTDGADADAGEFVAAPAAEISVALGDLTGASGVLTITFRVTID